MSSVLERVISPGTPARRRFLHVLMSLYTYMLHTCMSTLPGRSCVRRVLRTGTPSSAGAAVLRMFGACSSTGVGVLGPCGCGAPVCTLQISRILYFWICCSMRTSWRWLLTGPWAMDVGALKLLVRKQPFAANQLLRTDQRLFCNRCCQAPQDAPGVSPQLGMCRAPPLVPWNAQHHVLWCALWS